MPNKVRIHTENLSEELEGGPIESAKRQATVPDFSQIQSDLFGRKVLADLIQVLDELREDRFCSSQTKTQSH